MRGPLGDSQSTFNFSGLSGPDVDTQALFQATADSEMLDLETQLIDGSSLVPTSSIPSFGERKGAETDQRTSDAEEFGGPDNGVHCNCGVDVRTLNLTSVQSLTVVLQDDDECCFCEGGCASWYHIWSALLAIFTLLTHASSRCMGYHTAKDPRLPKKFICFECSVRQASNWLIIENKDMFPTMKAKFAGTLPTSF